MSRNWLRRCRLTLVNDQNGLDLSSMRIHFRTCQLDNQTPNNATIRVFNLSDDTARKVQKEYQRVVLEAGYVEGDFGIIFAGTIKQVRRGRINQMDTYLDVLAADGDQPYNFGFVNKSLKAGAKLIDQLNAVGKGMELERGYVPDLPPTALSRGKVLFGMGRDSMRDISNTAGGTWSIQDGKIQIIPLTGYLPGEAVVLNSQTGLIGLPEQTEGGIYVRALLNPKMKVGGLLQINNASIQRALLGGNLLFASSRLEDLPGLLPKVTDDGFYRVYVAEYEGDTRGGPWYVNVTALAVDRSAAPADSVAAYG